MNVSVIQGDIVKQSTDAIVNAANSELRLGGGIDNAIRTAAGFDMEIALKQHRFVGEGTAIVTPGFRLPAKHVIHTVAPRWLGGSEAVKRRTLFQDCHRAVLKLAGSLAAKTLAFPCVGTGAFGWPPELAADAAFEVIYDWIDEGGFGIEQITFVCPNPTFTSVYEEQRKDWLG